MSGPVRVSSFRYYQQFNGHPVELLDVVHRGIISGPVIWLLGDSSLDNKHWVRPWVEPAPAYSALLEPKQSRADVCHWINIQSPPSHVAINAAIEASTVADREDQDLPGQDAFVRDHLQPQDVLIVSVGGNDVVMSPSLWTVVCLCFLVLLPVWTIHRWNPFFRHMVHLFGARVRAYIGRVTERTQPSKILVCSIYFPCTRPHPFSWARRVLSWSGYDKNPDHIQGLIRQIHSHVQEENASCGLTQVALFDALDASNEDHYVARVEPSSEGGRLIAQHLLDEI